MTGDHRRKDAEEVEVGCTSPPFLSILDLTSQLASFGVQSAPSDQLAFTNGLIVHPNDFPDGQHVLVKQQFPLTTR